MTGSFHISLFEGTLHVAKIHAWFKIANITHALPVPLYQQTDFTPKRVFVSRLHDTELYKGVFTWENSHRREFHTGMTFWFRIAFTLWLGHFISRYLKVHFMLLKYTRDSKSQTLRMHFPFHSTSRPISHQNACSFHVYMIPLRDFVPEWHSRPGTTTRVNSCRSDSRRHDILWRYDVNKCRAMRGNRSDSLRRESHPGVM